MKPLIFLLLLAGLVGTTSATTTNATATPSTNMTSPPVNMTSSPVNMTSPPVNMTSSPVNMTSPPVNMTSPPVNMTSPPVNMTSPPVNMTSPPVNMTSPPVNVTSPPVNMTSPPANMTSPPANMTSPPVNMTSPPITTTFGVHTTPAPPAEPKLELEFKLQENFTSDLTDPNSQKFQELSSTVSGVLNQVYASKFGNSFNRTVITGFSPGSIVANAEVIFNEGSSLPNASSVASTLVEAASGSNFSLSVDPSSISAKVVQPATEAPTTVVPSTSVPGNATSQPVNMTSPPVNVTSPPVNVTSPPVNVTSPPVNVTSPPVNMTSPPVNMTSPPITTTFGVHTTPAPPAEPKLELEFKLQENFTSDLTDPNSQKFQELSSTVSGVLNQVYASKFGNSFNRTVITGFSPGSIVANAEVIFNEGSSVPNASSVASTLVEAASGSNFSLSVDPSSISAKVVQPATEAPTTVVPSTSVPGNATSQPVNMTSPSFNMTSPPVNMTSPPVNMTSPPVTMTSPPVNMTSPPVNMTSPPVNMTSPPVTMTSPPVNMTSPPVNMTSPPANMTSPPVTMTSPPVNMTSPPVNMTSPPITTTFGVHTTPAPPAEPKLELEFKLQENFTSDLADPNSQKFQELSDTVSAVLNKVYADKFGNSFNRTVITGFSPGSIVANAEVIFNEGSSVPNASSVASTLVEAASGSNFSLSVDPSSISAKVVQPATEAPTTVVPSTSVPGNATSQPVNMTSPPVNVTSPLVNMTSPPVNMTSPPANVTSPPVNMTSPPVNMTSPPVNMTSPPVNMTSPPANLTSPPVNVTSPPANVTSPPVTIAPTTTTPAPPPEPKIELGFKLQDNFTEELANTSSPAFQKLSTTVAAALDTVYSAQFGAAFNRTIIKGFSRGSIAVKAELIFNNVTTLPNASSAADTLKTAAASSNFSLSVNTSSVSAAVVLPTEAPTTPSPPLNTTSSPGNVTTVATTAAPSADSKVTLGFSLQQNFTSQLANTSSQEFKDLANKVQAVLDGVYKTKFGSGFLRSVINSFSQGSVVVNSELIFNNASSVPDTTAVANALVEAATNNSNFSLPVNVSSVVATRVNASTAAPISAAANTTAAPNATATTAVTDTTTTASTNPPSSTEGTLGLSFSLNQTFTSDLSNSSSAAFQTLATQVVTEINRVGAKLFQSSFLRSIVNEFKSGSVAVTMTLVFKDKNSVPSASDATSQLSSELANSSLNVVPGSVSAQSTSTSTSAPRPTVGSLAVFSLTLLAVTQILIGP